MLFRPNFCANCGEKIERADWGLLVSRRFCAVCEAEFKGHDMIPRIVVGLGILTGIFGFGSYLNSGTASDARVLRQPAKLAGQSAPSAQIVSSNLTTERTQNVDPPAVNNIPPSSNSQSGAPITRQPAKRPNADEPASYCGAETKKGTPCSRRVKGNTRCFQHTGMPAMAAVERLSSKQQ